MCKTGIIAIVVIGLLAGPCAVATAQDGGDGMPGLVTEEVGPGVERIISDGVGHDLDETYPTNRYDMDRIAIAADGTVWLTTTYHGSDNEAHPDVVSLVWALGQPGTWPQDGFGELIVLADGTPLANVGDTGGVVRFDGERFVPDDGPMLRRLADGGLLLSIDGADLVDQSPEGPVTSIPDLYAVLDPRRDVWDLLDEDFSGDVWAGDHWCWSRGNPVWGDDVGGSVTCQRVLEDGWMTGEPTSYLAGTYINRLAAAPDGSVWAVGGYDGGPGGLYRITLPEPPAE